MNDLLFKIWLGFGMILMIGEFLLPGLVVVFVGMGSLTVAAGIYFGYVEGISEQLITFFVSSLIYLLSLRFLVLRFIPSDSIKANVNEDDEVIGQVVEVVESIPANGVGRILYSGSSWQAKSKSMNNIDKGRQVKIISRDNITWIVEEL